MALTKIGKEGVTGISNSSNATAITIDSSENVGIGTSSPRSDLELTNSAGGELTLKYIGNSGFAAIKTDNSNQLLFSTNATSFTERMRIDSSGKILIGKTVAQVAGDGVALYPDGTYSFTTSVTSTGPLGYFYNEGSTANGFRYASFRLGAFAEVGTITTNGSSSVSYNTSSDYRLKNNVTYDWDATTRLKQLKPARFNFIVDADTTVDGFLAHEVQDIVPEAITGTHNEVEIWTQQQIDDGDAPDDTSAGDNKLDGDGNTVPVMQGIDQSKIVPLLCKTILELEARITALETA